MGHKICEGDDTCRSCTDNNASCAEVPNDSSYSVTQLEGVTNTKSGTHTLKRLVHPWEKSQPLSSQQGSRSTITAYFLRKMPYPSQKLIDIN